MVNGLQISKRPVFSPLPLKFTTFVVRQPSSYSSEPHNRNEWNNVEESRLSGLKDSGEKFWNDLSSCQCQCQKLKEWCESGFVGTSTLQVSTALLCTIKARLKNSTSKHRKRSNFYATKYSSCDVILYYKIYSTKIQLARGDSPNEHNFEGSSKALHVITVWLIVWMKQIDLPESVSQSDTFDK